MTYGKKFNFESEVSSVGLINDKWKIIFFASAVSSVGLINDKKKENYFRVGSVFRRPDQ